MYTLKLIGLSIASITVVLLIIGFFTKKSYTIQRDITIQRPVGDVFDYLRITSNHKKFNKWWMADPNVNINYTGNEGTPGSVAAWKSNDKNVGEGEQEIITIKTNERIDYELRFIKPFEGKANSYITTIPEVNNQTKVNWTFSSSMKYPMNIMLLFMDIPGMLAKDVDTSLSRLKNNLE